MTYSTAGGRRWRPGQLVLVVALLVAVGGSTGYLLASLGDGDQGQRAGGQQVDPGDTGDDGGAGDDGDDDGGGLGPCLPQTEQAARDAGSPGDLVVEFYLRTGNSQVWICRDAAGGIWYQGNRHRGSPGTDFPATGTDSLFLGTVERVGNGYVATNQDTDYRLSAEELVIVAPDGGTQTEPVVSRDPP